MFRQWSCWSSSSVLCRRFHSVFTLIMKLHICVRHYYINIMLTNYSVFPFDVVREMKFSYDCIEYTTTFASISSCSSIWYVISLVYLLSDSFYLLIWSTFFNLLCLYVSPLHCIIIGWVTQLVTAFGKTISLVSYWKRISKRFMNS